jgi:hypothetical protein
LSWSFIEMCLVGEGGLSYCSFELVLLRLFIASSIWEKKIEENTWVILSNYAWKLLRWWLLLWWLNRVLQYLSCRIMIIPGQVKLDSNKWKLWMYLFKLTEIFSKLGFRGSRWKGSSIEQVHPTIALMVEVLSWKQSAF